MTSGDRNTEENNMVRAPSMSLVRYFQSYYLRNLRSLGTYEIHPRHLDAAPRYRGHHLLGQGSFSHGRDYTSRNIDVPQTNPGSAPQPPPSDGPSIFNWMKLAIGSIFTLLLPFLYTQTQWKNIVRIGGEIETAKDVVEKTAVVVEKVAEMAEKASEEAAENLKDSKLQVAVQVVEHISKEIKEDARIVEDIIHKVDEIEEDVKTLIQPITGPTKHDNCNTKNDETKRDNETSTMKANASKI